MKPDNDTAILKALRSGLTTSTEIAAHADVKMNLSQVQNALNRLMDQGRVVRTKDSSSYRWAAIK